jgi:O-antigen ligase
MKPVVAFALIAAIAAVWLAYDSIAFPLALSFAPVLVDAIYGSDPLPPGGVTFLFAAWIALAIGIAVVRGRRLVGLTSAPVVLSFILIVFMAARLGASLDPSYGGKKLQLFVADNVLLLLGGIMVGARGRDTRRLLAVMLAISAASALLLVVGLATGSAYQTAGTGRFAIANQQWPIALGRSGADGLLLSIYAVLAWRSVSGRLWAAAILPVLAVSMLGAGSRGPVLGFAVALVVLLALIAGRGRTRQQLSRIAIPALIAIVFVPLLVPGSTVGRALSSLFGGASGLSTNGRANLWALAYSSFSGHPLLGVGTGSFAAFGTGESYPHNLILEMGLELGAFAAIAAAWFIISSLRRLFLAWRASVGTDRLEVSVVTALFVAALISAMVSGAIQDNRELWLWAGLGVGMSIRNVRVAQRSAQKSAKSWAPNVVRPAPGSR